MISFLKKVDEEGVEKKSKFMGKGDIIFLLVVASLAGGFWYFSKSAKEDTFAYFTRCDSLYTADRLSEAETCYEGALDQGYRSDSLDSVGYLRREKLETQRDQETQLAREIDSLLRVGDSATAWSKKEKAGKVYFLTAEVVKQWESLKAPVADPAAAPDSTAPLQP